MKTERYLPFWSSACWYLHSVRMDASGSATDAECHSAAMSSKRCWHKARGSSLQDSPAEGLWVLSKPEGVKAKVSWKVSWSRRTTVKSEMIVSARSRGFLFHPRTLCSSEGQKRAVPFR